MSSAPPPPLDPPHGDERRPDAVTIAQITVDDAYRRSRSTGRSPSRRTNIHIPYPWSPARRLVKIHVDRHAVRARIAVAVQGARATAGHRGVRADRSLCRRAARGAQALLVPGPRPSRPIGAGRAPRSLIGLLAFLSWMPYTKGWTNVRARRGVGTALLVGAAPPCPGPRGDGPVAPPRAERKAAQPGLGARLLIATGSVFQLGEGLAIGTAFAPRKPRSARSSSSASHCTTRRKAWRSWRQLRRSGRRSACSSSSG